jgi:hypothetical protein
MKLLSLGIAIITFFYKWVTAIDHLLRNTKILPFNSSKINASKGKDRLT